MTDSFCFSFDFVSFSSDIMKFYTTPYHSNLIKDKDRLAAFFEGIDEFFNVYINDINDNGGEKSKKLGTAFDIGCGSGVLSYFASNYFDSVIAIDIDNKIIDCAKKSFNEANIKNVIFINGDASIFDFKNESDRYDGFHEFHGFDGFADLIICEMMDTALIDEEEVPVLKTVKKYLKKGEKIIPQGIINIAEPVFMEKDYIHYEDEDFHGKKPKYDILGEGVKFAEFDFLDDFDEEFRAKIDFVFGSKFTNDEDNSNNSNNNSNNCSNNKVYNNKIFNGIKITTFTKINDNIICGPTPMFNPPLFVPIGAQKIANDKISIELSYLMGGGVETIKTSLITD